MKQFSSSESAVPIENLVTYIQNVSGIHDSDVASQQGLWESSVRGNDHGLLGDCRNREKLLTSQTDSRIPPFGIRFHSDHDRCLGCENTQDSKSRLHGLGKVISDSKYLKATQKLLDDVVNVKKALKHHSKHVSMNDSEESFAEWKDEHDSIPVSTREKQDLQNKMTKLSSMLNEVDRRYKQYHQEMQIVVSWFDEVAGNGAANTYTNLTLQTISCKFRLLKDAIKRRIKDISKRINETDRAGNGIGIPRLRFVDQQQIQVERFGPMHRHIWRPQRGLPGSSVSVLRAWLFEHFLHPYPKDSEKIMLATQTGLTRSQISNWFINARVRLWKPMVEEMYKEESIDAVMNSNATSETLIKKTSIYQKEDKIQSASLSSSYQIP